MAQVDFDLRDRLREVMEHAAEQITTINPMRHWSQFDKSVRDKVCATRLRTACWANFGLAAQGAQQLAEQVAAKLAGNPDGSPTGVALPRVRVGQPRRGVAPSQADGATEQRRRIRVGGQQPA
jgi:hypothetical protein